MVVFSLMRMKVEVVYLNSDNFSAVLKVVELMERGTISHDLLIFSQIANQRKWNMVGFGPFLANCK